MGYFHLAQELELHNLDLYLQNLRILQQQLDKGKLLFRQQLAECQQQENLIENLTKQRDALRDQYEAFLEQVGSSCCLPCTAPPFGWGPPFTG